jgi:hypothetical protein
VCGVPVGVAFFRFFLEPEYQYSKKNVQFCSFVSNLNCMSRQFCIPLVFESSRILVTPLDSQISGVPYGLFEFWDTAF